MWPEREASNFCFGSQTPRHKSSSSTKATSAVHTVPANIIIPWKWFKVLLHHQASTVCNKQRLISVQPPKVAFHPLLGLDRFGLPQRPSHLRRVFPVPSALTNFSQTNIFNSGPMMNKSVNGVRASSWASRRVLSNVDNTPSARGRFSSNPRGSLADDLSAASSTTVLPLSYTTGSKSENSSPRKSAVRAGTTSPMPSKREIMISTPRSAI